MGDMLVLAVRTPGTFLISTRMIVGVAVVEEAHFGGNGTMCALRVDWLQPQNEAPGHTVLRLMIPLDEYGVGQMAPAEFEQMVEVLGIRVPQMSSSG